MTRPDSFPPLRTSHLSADWLRSNGHDVSPLGERAAAVVAVVFSGIYNAPRPATAVRKPRRVRSGRLASGWADPHFVEVLIDRSLHSWDDNTLTRLVVASHDAALRVQIAPRTFRHIVLGFSARERDGSIMRGCPTIDEAVRIVRTHYTVPPDAFDGFVAQPPTVDDDVPASPQPL